MRTSWATNWFALIFWASSGESMRNSALAIGSEAFAPFSVTAVRTEEMKPVQDSEDAQRAK